jgi:hypothetical protein
VGTGDNVAERSKLNIESYVNELAETAMPDSEPVAQQAPAPLESVLKGIAVELWSDSAGSLFIVADEADARRLHEPRGTIYTAAELRRIVRIGDTEIVRQIHEWKRTFDGRVRESGK